MTDMARFMFDLTLSFDNGPDAQATPFVLDVLKQRGLRTTFFVVGEKLVAPGARALAERALAEGHVIGNHTWTHSGPLGRRSEPDLAEHEIGRTQEAMGALAHAHRFFRPQGGGGALGPHLLAPAVVDFLKAGRFSLVLWNAIPGDWEDPEGWVERALGQCRAQPWTLMVLHDIESGAMRHLERFLDAVAMSGGRIRQDFPPDCVPMLDGVVVRPIESYVTASGV
ncbi:MAG TPA: polysaccharide deacetylase family protein [Pseudolabrys sp.]|nr:polysaccharide deacetylase family protein [Pseudolabrys sp.]